MSQRRIALIGNMNNNFFAITRYLRDAGYDAHLFYRIGMEHFQPKADTFTVDYANYCHQVSWLDGGFHNIDEDAVRTDLSGFDFYIGQGDEAAAAYRSGFNMDVYYPYGSDVYKYAYLPQKYSTLNKLWALTGLNKSITYRQMLGGTGAKYINGVIRNASHVWVVPNNEDFEMKVRGLKLKGEYSNIPMPLVYYKEYEGLIDNHDIIGYDEIDLIRSEYDFIVLYHGRQEWKTYHNEFTGKNTHHLIIGFADFIKRNIGKKALLIMLEYGSDTEYSKELIKDLGISAYVKWFPTMYRKDLMYLISNVDICTGEFGKSYIVFGTIAEALTMKKPIIHYREDRLYADYYDELYPMLCAREPNEICDMLEYASQNADEVKAIGIKANLWLKKYFIQQPLAQLQRVIEQKFTSTQSA